MKTNRFLVVLLAVFVVLAVAASAAMGYQVTVNRINGYYSGDGGEFTLTPSADFAWILSYYTSYSTYSYAASNLVGFESFCIEKNEYVNIPATYDATIEPYAIAGGIAGGSPDPVSLGTAWLYNNFVLGSLLSYNYTPGSGRATTAGQLQQAIWYLENELALASPLSNTFLSAANTQFGSLANAMNNNTTYPVYALNLTTADGTLKQSMLVRVSEPATLILLGTALIGIVGLGRRFRK